jgi:hypothetical protein
MGPNDKKKKKLRYKKGYVLEVNEGKVNALLNSFFHLSFLCKIFHFSVLFPFSKATNMVDQRSWNCSVDILSLIHAIFASGNF